MHPQQSPPVNGTMETNESNTPENVPLQEPETTLFMILFSLYIALAGFIYNFDLGQNNLYAEDL
jgi:hypothetical protein